MNKINTIEYNKDKGAISLCTYSDDGFLEYSSNITDAVMTLAIEKLYDNYNLDIGDEVVITKKKSLNKITKFEVKK